MRGVQRCFLVSLRLSPSARNRLTPAHARLTYDSRTSGAAPVSQFNRRDESHCVHPPCAATRASTARVQHSRADGIAARLVDAPPTASRSSSMSAPLPSTFTAGTWSSAGVPWQHDAGSRRHLEGATEPALLLLLTRAAEAGPRASWSHQSFATIMEQNNTLSVIMFMAMFGGSTFLLFLLCYCCQRKMRENAFATLDNAVIIHHPQASTNPAPQATQIILSGPPPNYDAVVKKNPADLEPPPYEVAVASLQASGYV
ncbi:uncharacterized protein [Dermacentor andersoni]|uniref:uncharacterized protein isoform X1 n=1 Tax=Dermacentor andersoni TaxID=34620 RepID=UPI0021553E5F|nr:uncharacterized protein LOC126544379 isoform X1 [Dermacentor andersoni]